MRDTMTPDKFELTPWITEPTITVGEVIRRLERIIRDEPLRLNMDAWLVDFAGKIHAEHHEPPDDLPACGTVACVAGWTAVMFRPALDWQPINIHNKAEKVLGYIPADVLADPNITSDEERERYRTVGELFFCHPSEEFNELDDQGFGSLGRPGTLEHAAAINRRLHVYLERHPELEQRVLITADVQAWFAPRPCD
jgi:hypothetical protein